MIIKNCNSTNLNFKQKAGEKNFKPAVYSADQFIADSISVEKKRIKGNFIARNWGSLVRLDFAKKPKGWDVEKWLYYAKTMGI